MTPVRSPAVWTRRNLEADAVVIGAGAAGLAMAGALAHPARRLRLIVLEPRAIKPNPRRWLIAAEPGHALGDFVDASLDSVELCGRAHRLPRVRIHHVRAGAVQARALERLSNAPLARIDEGVRIGEISGRTGDVSVDTSLGLLRARAVIDTRPGPAAAVEAGAWTQIAYAARLKGVDARPGFSLSRPFPDARGVGLDQVVILPGGEALIESVRFAPPGDKGEQVKARAAALVQQLGGDPGQTRLRRLVLPLTQTRTGEPAGPAVIARAGVGGLRFSIGTAAVRLTRWAEAAAARFTETGRLFAPPGPPAQARAATALAMSRFHQGPDVAAAWLGAVMEEAGPEAALRFLAGTPGWRDGALALIRARRKA
jgi:lycopene beta-cyclase